MTEVTLADAVEHLVFAGVALTTQALVEVRPSMDLTFPQWRVLLIVGASDGGLTMTEVARRVGITLPATSRQLRRLAARGLIEITRDERDRRAARVRTSDIGARTREAVIGFRRESIDKAVRGLGRESDPVKIIGGVATAIERNMATHRELAAAVDQGSR